MPWLDDIDLRTAQDFDRSLRDQHTVAGVQRAVLEALERFVPSDTMRWDHIAAGRPAAPPPAPYRLTIDVPARPEHSVVIGLDRLERPFSLRDHDLVELMSPAIRRELNAAQARSLAADPLPGSAVVLLDGYGEIVQGSVEAERWLAEHFGAAEHPGWLPEPVADWLALPPRPPLVSIRDGRLLTIRLLPANPHVLLVSESVARFRDDALSALGLSGREREVLQAARALADEALIADALFLSPHAVRERLERVEAKLGVRTGDEAVAEALRAST